MAAKAEGSQVQQPRSVAELEAELDEARAERDEALARETATAEVLEVINSSPGNLPPVFDAILEKATRLCQIDFGSLWTYDGNAFHPVARHRLPDPFWEYLQEHTPPALARLVGGNRFIHIADVQGTVDQTDFSREIHRLGLDTVRSLLMVALRKDEALFGAIVSYRREVRPFTEKQIALLQNFAAQAVIAMENARLINETREALEQQTATAEVLGVINSSLGDLAPVFEAILEKAVRLCEADFGVLNTFDGERWYPTALRNVPVEYAEFIRREPLVFPPDSAIGRIVAGEAVAHFVDAATAQAQLASPLLQTLQRLGDVRSAVFAALRKDGVLLGVIIVYRREVRPFTDKQIALLQNFAAQAVIAMENARLITETREALEQQTATAEVLGVINSSPGDLTPVFNAMLEKAMQLCEAEFGILNTYDGENFHRAAARGVPPAFEEWRLRQGPIGPRTGHGPIASGESVLHTLDLMAEDSYRDGDPDRRAFVELAGARTALVVALRMEGTLLGTITIFRQEVRAFTDQQIALLQNFAAQAVIAMENARLLTETREALEQQTATAEVLGVINSSPGDLAPVFDALLGKALRLCGASYGVLTTWDGERLHRAAIHGASVELIEALGQEMAVPHPGSVADRLLQGEDFIYTADIRQDARLARAPRVQTWARVGGARSYICVPLRKDDQLLGFIGIFHREARSFTNQQIALLQNFAAQAVIAMENARLITETREALEQQTATAEVLGVINSSPGDLAPVWDAMLEKATRLCEAASGILWTYNGSRFRAAAVHGATEEYAEWLHSLPDPVPSPSLARIASGEKIVRDDDLTTAPSTLAYAHTLAGMRTGFLVALRKGDALVGAIRIFRQDPRPFSDKHIVLVENFAAQAVIAMENARLITETRDALEQQTATAEVLQVINASPGDLGPVFEAILEKAHALCGAEIGSLTIYDGETNRAVATRGLAPALADRLRQGFRPGPEHPIRKLLSGVRIVQVSDVGESTDPIARASFDADIRTSLYVPLRKDDRLLGLIVAARQEVRLFSDKEITLLENFGAQAVIAMENARLINETREALEQQTATAEVLGVINSSPDDLAPVFDAILEKATRLCEAPFGHLRTWDGEYFHLGAVHGESRFRDWVRQRGPIRPDRDASGPMRPLGRILAGERVVSFADVPGDERYLTSPPGFKEMAEASGVRSAIWVALHKDDALLGTIAVYRREVRRFTDEQIALLQNFAAQAVIAMENARLLGELRQRTEEVAELNRGLEARVAEQVGELGRVGRLKRFLAPQLAEMIVSQGDEKILESHRREIVVVFCDLRGYTAFTETAEPEEVLEFLRQYHGALGPLVSQFEGTLDQFSGDGIMVFFNDPVPCPDPAERAVKMAVSMREEASRLIARWRRHGCDLGFGAGIAQGFATLGQIGFSDRSGYTAIGTVCNLAARLCDEAKDGQILISSRIAEAVEAVATLEDLGNLDLKGLRRPVAAFNVAQSTSPAEARPNLTVVARDTGA